MLQLPPFGFFCVHTPPMHKFPPEQSAFVLQAVPQLVELAQLYGAQLEDCPAAQLPEPSHCWPVSVAPEHIAIPHTVPRPYRAQAPAPLHWPVRWHVDGGSIGQSLSGSVPVATGPQTPSIPPPLAAALHAWQAPLQASAQHTPSTQNPDWHCDATLQGAPPG